MRGILRVALVVCAGLAGALVATAQTPDAVSSRVLATSKTSTLEKELNEAAEAGYRFSAVMGGETAIGGKEVVAVVTRTGQEPARFAYKLLATSRTSTMEKELARPRTQASTIVRRPSSRVCLEGRRSS